MMCQSLAFSRRASSASTASRMNMARLFGPARASIRSNTPGSSRTSVGLSPSAGLPMRERLAGIALSDNVCIKPLSLIDWGTDNGYITVIANRGKQMLFTLDSAGTVAIEATFEDFASGLGDEVAFTDLTPFAQGYIEALLSEPETARAWWLRHSGPFGIPAAAPFRDLAPETLARIIADCEGVDTVRMRSRMGFKPGAEGGRAFLQTRQAGKWAAFPPLTVKLGNDGKLRFAA